MSTPRPGSRARAPLQAEHRCRRDHEQYRRFENTIQELRASGQFTIPMERGAPRRFLYVATGLTEGNPALEPGEQIETLLVTRAAALEMARDGRIRDAKTLVGLLYYDRFGTC